MKSIELVRNYLNYRGAYFTIGNAISTRDGDYIEVREGTIDPAHYCLRVKDGHIYNVNNEDLYAEDELQKFVLELKKRFDVLEYKDEYDDISEEIDFTLINFRNSSDN